MNKILFLFLLMTPLWINDYAATAQQSDSIPPRVFHRFGIDLSPGYVLPTHPVLRAQSVRDAKLDKSFSLHLKYGFQFSQRTYWGRLYPKSYQGIGFSYNSFFNPEVYGTPISLYAFQHAPICGISRHLSFDYEWNFGLSTGWTPYHPDHNPNNLIVGSKINAYINLNFLLNWHLDKEWSLLTGIGLSHYSNGNTHYPNSGVNTLNARIGLMRVFDRKGMLQQADPVKNKQPEVLPHVSYDLVVYGATRAKAIVKENYLVPGSFGVVGLNFYPMYNFNKYFKAGISLDSQWDESANVQEHVAGTDENGELQFYWPSLREQLSVGFSLRGELVMPIFSVNIGFGHNIFYKGSDLGGFYQIAVLKTSLTRNLYLHVGYQLCEFHTPKNLMLGLGYRFHNKRK